MKWGCNFKSSICICKYIYAYVVNCKNDFLQMIQLCPSVWTKFNFYPTLDFYDETADELNLR